MPRRAPSSSTQRCPARCICALCFDDRSCASLVSPEVSISANVLADPLRGGGKTKLHQGGPPASCVCERPKHRSEVGAYGPTLRREAVEGVLRGPRYPEAGCRTNEQNRKPHTTDRRDHG